MRLRSPPRNAGEVDNGHTHWRPGSAAPAEERNGQQVDEASDRPEPVVWVPALSAADLDKPGHDNDDDQYEPGDSGRPQVNLREALVAADGQPADGLAAPGEQQQEQAEACHDHEPI